ncbi:MAG: hypothetical protein M0Z51_16665 [Propionibacterium sp.]|nr:hypothetical protein [Propionibacterium sp.]
MSDETRHALDDAIRAHVLDEYGDPRIVTDYAVLTASQGLDDAVTSYFYACRVGMPAHTLTGLIAHFLRTFERLQAGEETSDD